MMHYPDGAMCLACTAVDKRCDHLPFNLYRVIRKPDEKGDLMVLCEEFVRRPKEAKPDAN